MSQDEYDKGLKTRRKVLGDAWVDKAIAGTTPFNAEFQELITRYAWNEIWNRPGLEHRVRRMLVLAMTLALGRWEEFALHVRAGIGSGELSEDELSRAEKDLDKITQAAEAEIDAALAHKEQELLED